MKKSEVYIRADGDAHIGLGHLYRCLALAEMLENHFRISFHCKTIPNTLLENIQNKGFTVKILKRERDFISALKGDEIIVLDHYGLSSEYQLRIKEKHNKLVCIDDLHDKKFYSDLIINHAPGISKNNYDAPKYTKFALGPDYSILRKGFLKVAQQDRQISKIETVFVCFGGSDPLNLTYRTVKILLQLQQITKINIILGGAYNHSSIYDLSIANPSVNIFKDIGEDSLIEIMQECQCAIVPSSTILFEISCVKMPVLSGYFTDNQKLIYGGFKANGCLYPVGNFSSIQDDIILWKLKHILNEENNLIIDAQKRIIDGKSKNRFIKLFEELC